MLYRLPIPARSRLQLMPESVNLLPASVMPNKCQRICVMNNKRRIMESMGLGIFLQDLVHREYNII